MTFARFTSALAIVAGLAVSTGRLSAEELSVATFVPPQHHSNTVMFKWFADELETRSGGDLTMKLYPAGPIPPITT